MSITLTDLSRCNGAEAYVKHAMRVDHVEEGGAYVGKLMAVDGALVHDNALPGERRLTRAGGSSQATNRQPPEVSTKKRGDRTAHTRENGTAYIKD